MGQDVRQKWAITLPTMHDELLKLLEKEWNEGTAAVPAFCDRNGQVIETFVYQTAFADRLLYIQSHMPEIIPADVDILESFGISRSFKRGSTSTART